MWVAFWLGLFLVAYWYIMSLEKTRSRGNQEEVVAHFLAREDGIRQEYAATVERQAIWIANQHLVEPYQSPGMAGRIPRLPSTRS